jgi:pilus assembly protein CpaE
MTDGALQPRLDLSSATWTVMIFVQDRDSEGVLRQCLSDLSISTAEFVNGGIDAAIPVLRERPSPQLLVVDIQGVEDPEARIQELANVCDPDTGVVVIGNTNDIRLYRGLKAAGVVEYFYKPLVGTLVTKTCHAILTGSTEPAASRTGKLIAVVSVRGGSGGTTIAAVTAWHLAEQQKRRVGLIDLDLQYGDAALLLDVKPNSVLKEALDRPERVDDLFLDRGVIHVGERLGLLAGLEALDDFIAPDASAVMSLLEHMLHRYRYVIVDVPSAVAPCLRQLLNFPGTIVLVSTASLVCARDVARLREKIGPNSPEHTILHILNKNGTGDALPIEEFVRAAGAAPDITIPLAREIGGASLLGARGLQTCSTLQRALGPLFRQLSGEGPAVAPGSFLRKLFG